jgi:methylated-DNA-[protein]-cysteine S-methyltransferase
MMAQLSFLSPLGDITVSEEDGVIVSLDWGRGPREFQEQTPLLVEARDQVHGYFDGRVRRFDLPLAPFGTDYERAIWDILQAIPFGHTRSYGEVAKETGSVARAVGRACGANPIPIIIPCHRVLAAGGKLGGFSGSGGVESKVALLRLEGALL